MLKVQVSGINVILFLFSFFFVLAFSYSLIYIHKNFMVRLCIITVKSPRHVISGAYINFAHAQRARTTLKVQRYAKTEVSFLMYLYTATLE